MAFGGVATGSIKAQDADTAINALSITAGIPKLYKPNTPPRRGSHYGAWYFHRVSSFGNRGELADTHSPILALNALKMSTQILTVRKLIFE